MKNIINATVTVAKKTYSKLNISEFEKGQLSMLTHVGQKNHVRWDVPNLKKLSDASAASALPAATEPASTSTATTLSVCDTF